jgi:hypothetical protein
MSDHLRDRVAADVVTPPAGDGTWGKTYRYLRTSMVALLVALGVSVLYQTWRQDFHILSSVSAYYYTPAQAIFVGALVALGACMVALRGTTDTEDVFLNIGGMCAAVVAIVPTSRGADFRAAVRACRQDAGPLLTDRASKGLDCPTVQALVDATRANVENNMFSLLVLGLFGLAATVLFFSRRPRGSGSGRFWLGFGAAALVYLLALVAFLAYTDWFIDYGHYIAGFGLLVCILVVAVENARRRGREAVDRAGAGATDAGRAPVGRGHYILIAWLMAVVTVVLTPLMLLGALSLFWLEIAVAALFAAFWLAQTIEQGDREPAW